MDLTELRFRDLSRLEYRLLSTPLSPGGPGRVLVVEFVGSLLLSAATAAALAWLTGTLVTPTTLNLPFLGMSFGWQFANLRPSMSAGDAS